MRYGYELENQDKRLSQKIANAMAPWLPRRATVTRSEGTDVWVQFGTEGPSAPESRFVSTVAGVPAGSSGWVITLGGRKGLFIATGVAVPIPFVAHSGSSGTSISTTSTSAYTYHTLRTLRVPPGSYLVNAVASVPTSRNVATGEMWVQMRVGGVTGTARGGSLASASLNIGANQWFPMSAEMNGVQVATNDVGDLALEIGVRGSVTAGTTQARIAYMQGILTRIG